MTNKTLHMLIVDDEVDLKELFKQKFRREIRSGDLEFTFAHNGKEALEALGNNDQISLVVSDINMPEMDGLTLIDNINSQFPDVITVVLSAYGDMNNIRAAMNLGAYDFLTKPINFEDLTITINKTNQHIEKLRAAEQNKSKLSLILDELKVANSIQQSILPKTFYNKNNCQIFGFMKPARAVGGDFYDYFQLDEDHVGFVVGDVSGKGVPAALFMTVARTLMRANGLNINTPSNCLKKVNDSIFEDNKELMFVTIFYGILNVKTGLMRYTSAGHDIPFIIKRDGQTIDIDKAQCVVAGIRDESEFTEAEIQLDKDDTLIVFTDGLTDAMKDNKFYSRERLLETATEHRGVAPNIMINKIYHDVEAFSAGAEQFDDITLLIMRYGDNQSYPNDVDDKTSAIDFELMNKVEDVTRTVNDLEKFLQTNGINSELVMSCSLVVNELLANLINHAYEDDEPHNIELKLIINDGLLTMTLIDDGVEFNPKEHATPDINLPPEEREIGGLGVFMVKTFVDELIYKREAGKNILSLIKKL